MDKITDLERIKKYYCSECERFHIRKYKYVIDKFGKRIKTKDTPFFNHKEFAYKLIPSELFNLQFNRSYKRYNIKEHKKTKGSNKR